MCSKTLLVLIIFLAINGPPRRCVGILNAAVSPVGYVLSNMLISQSPMPTSLPIHPIFPSFPALLFPTPTYPYLILLPRHMLNRHHTRVSTPLRACVHVYLPGTF